MEGSRRLMSYESALHVLATFTEQVVQIHNHIILLWIPSISRTKTVIMKLTKKTAMKLPDNTPVTYLLSSLCNCTVYKCQLHWIKHLYFLRHLTACYCVYIVGERRGLLSAKSLKKLSYLIFLTQACSAYRIARLCSILPPETNLLRVLY